MIRVFSQYVSAKSAFLFVFEAGLMLSALLGGVRLRFWSNPGEYVYYTQVPEFVWQAAVFIAVFQICFIYCDLYDLSALRRRNEELISLGQSLGAGCILLGLLYFIFPPLLLGRGVFFISTAVAAICITMNRIVLDAAWPIAAPRQKILILGEGQLATTVARELVRRDDLNVELEGFVSAEAGHEQRAERLLGRPILGACSDLERIAQQHHISRIVVALEDRRGALPIHQLVKLRVQGIYIEDVHSTMAALTGRVWLEAVRPSWFVFSHGFHRSRFTQIVKRALDLSIGLVGLVLSAPFMLLIAALIRLDSAGPALFCQDRVGMGGRRFNLLKFRSMRLDAETNGGAQWAQKNDARVTRVGRVLRKFRLDELPQFINVVRGDMSFVGPRPERPVFVEQLRKQIAYYDERHSVRPGLTGWAQVEYEYGSTIEDALRKLEYDLFYLQNMSILFDCLIILKTIRIVLTGRGGR